MARSNFFLMYSNGHNLERLMFDLLLHPNSFYSLDMFNLMGQLLLICTYGYGMAFDISAKVAQIGMLYDSYKRPLLTG